jgi:hypothetical protein
VRGDSLRDFYAKTLAVFGLGLLAGAGAAVDYWPVGSPLPVVASARLPRPVLPALTQQLDQRIPAPSLAGPAYVRGTIHPKNVGSAKFLVAAAVPGPTQTPPAVSQPVPDVTLATAEMQWSAVFTSFPSATSQDLALASVAPVSDATSATGVIGGALRKTKDSLVRTTAATGGTIADAFKGVVGAFKKVTPF